MQGRTRLARSVQEHTALELSRLRRPRILLHSLAPHLPHKVHLFIRLLFISADALPGRSWWNRYGLTRAERCARHKYDPCSTWAISSCAQGSQKANS